MSKFLLILMFCVLSFTGYSNKLQAYFSYSVFESPADGPYVETYMSVVGNSVEYIKNENGKFQGQINVTMVFLQNEEVKFENSYNLMSPELNDTTQGFVNFLDQQRVPLQAGNYQFKLSIKDQNSEEEAFESGQDITVGLSKDKIELSDFQIVESYTKSINPSIITKSGYDLIPYPNDYFPSDMENLVFYLEVYNSKKIYGDNGRYLLNYYIERFETQYKLNDYNRISRQSAKEVNVVLGKFNLKELPSGNYNLVLEVRNTANELVASKKKFFQRSNPAVSIGVEDIESISLENSFVQKMNDADTLSEFIRCLRPISDTKELTFADNQLASAELTLMQQFFLNFWKKRDYLEPEMAWINYKEQVDIVQNMYGTRVMKGYQTDRGRVYLQYGKPNSTRMFDQMRGKPYEIWHYYKVGNQSNIKFVFVNENPSTQIYRLRHSDAIGEPSDPTWRSKTNLIDLDDSDNNGDFGNPTRISDF